MSDNKLDLTFNINTDQLAQVICEQNNYGRISELILDMVSKMEDEKLSILTVVKILEKLVEYFTSEKDFYTQEEYELTFLAMSGTEGRAAGQCLGESEQYLQATQFMLELSRSLLAGHPSHVLDHLPRGDHNNPN